MAPEKTVLILDDEVLVAIDIGEELASRGWTILDVVTSLSAAEAVVQSRRPDLALLDMNLRGQLSFSLARELLGYGAKVVFLSGNTAQDLPEDLQDCAFLGKPVNYDVLHKTLSQAISAAV